MIIIEFIGWAFVAGAMLAAFITPICAVLYLFEKLGGKK
jgi:hypothetical protein